MFSEIATVDEPETSLQSEQAESEQSKQKKCLPGN